MSFNPIRSITLSNVFRVLGITLAICLVFGIVDSGVSWAGTPVVRNIPTTNSSAHSFLISLANSLSTLGGPFAKLGWPAQPHGEKLQNPLLT